jgi:hypothetical protein
VPYLPIDLDGKKKWPAIARGIGVESVAQGFTDLWEQVWIAKKDTVTTLQLECLFGASGDRVGAVLAAFEFLEPMGEGLWRVRGAAKWLGVMDSRSDAGKASAARPRDQKGRLLSSRRPTGVQQTSNGTPADIQQDTQNIQHPSNTHPAPVQQVLDPPSSKTPALTPNTQHPTPKQKEETAWPAPESVGDIASLGALKAPEAVLAGARVDRRSEDSPGAALRPDAPVALQSAWNEHAHPDLPRWREMGEGRERKVRARLKERPLSEWIVVIQRISASSFCRGKTERGWRADPDWLLNPSTAAKVLEGRYDDRAFTNASGAKFVRAQDVDQSKHVTGVINL